MATVFCSNPRGGKEYHKDFEKCPFCGSPNTGYSKEEAMAHSTTAKKSNLLISTTHIIENALISEYIDIITVNMVIGANMFKDFFASITDVVGGFSGKYKKELETLYEEGLNELKERAVSKDANAVIGLQVGFSEISGKDKSMFMLSMTGTAVKIKPLPNYNILRLRKELKSFLEDGLITLEEYEKEIEKISKD